MEAYKQALAAYDPLESEQARPQKPGITAVPGEPVWCMACAAKIRFRLNDLDDLAAILQAYADGHREAPAEWRVSGTEEQRSPSQAADDVDEITRMLTEWEGIYREHRGWPLPRRNTDLASWVTMCTCWLVSHLNGIMASPIAQDFGEEILGCNREFTGKAKAGVRKLRKPMRCPSCSLLLLTYVDGDEYVRCGNVPECGLLMTVAEYEAHVEALAGGRKTAA